ncbi:MAG TPA: glycosyltransferase family 1 protein [Bacteroidota bacterium]|nr:glycosyltransferase family 1 protein [Bacteroidota bacterium]
MKKSKILINATCDSSKPSGVGVFNREITKNLISIDPEIFFVYETIDFIPEYKNKKILSKSFSSESGTKGHFLRWTWEQTLLNFSCYKLIFSPVPEGPLFFKNKAIVVHDILPIKYPEYYPRQKYYFKYLLPLIIRTSKIVFFDSYSAKSETYNYYKITKTPYKVIYPGYDVNLYRKIDKGFIKSKYGIEKYFLFVGEMRPYKNVMNAIHAFFKTNLEKYRLIIVGRKDELFFPKIEKLVLDLDLQNRVKFMDYVPLNELPHFYANAEALVFPSEYEGFGLPALEAMACGTPVITTKLTSIPEVCGDAAYYISHTDIEGMSKAMTDIASNNLLKNSLQTKSLERAKHFSWEKSAKEYYDTLKGLI